MTASLRAEWLKLVTTRAFFGLVAAAALLSAFIAFGLMAQGPPPWELAAEEVGQIGSVSALSGGLFCLVLGLRAFTDEFRYGTIVHTAFADPRRRRATASKAVVAAVGGVLVTTVSLALTAGAIWAATTLSGGSVAVGGDAGRVALGLVVGGALWAVVGVGVAALIRQPVPAVVTALLWVLVFENVAGVVLGPVTRFLPGQSAQIFARGAAEAGQAAVVMAAWAALLWTAGWLTLRRRDVL